MSSSMSDYSESSLDDISPQPVTYASNSADNVCRDFLRNVCRRGSHCRYRHPVGGSVVLPGVSSELIFCHDFQNAGCQRAACRFVHCTRDQEELYHQTGQLPPTVTLVPNGLAPSQLGVNENGIGSYGGEPPVCMDFLKGECRRASKCKYQHVSASDSEIEQMSDRQNSLQMAAVEAAMIFEETNRAKKRRLVDRFGLDLVDPPPALYHRVPTAATAVVSFADYQLLEEENRALQHKVDDLRRHIAVLVATNELLLEQNARYRSTCNVIAAVPPIVGVSQVLTPTISSIARTQLHHGGPYGITTMATLGHVTINGHREILVQPAIVNQQATPAGQLAAATGADQAASGVSVAIVPMTIPLDSGGAPPNMQAAQNMAAIGGQNMSALSGQSISGLGGGQNMPTLPGQNMSGLGGQNISVLSAQTMPTLSASNLVQMTRASMMQTNMAMDVSNINLNVAPPLSVANMIISGPTMAANMPLAGGGPNMVAMSGSNMEPPNLQPNMAFGGGSSIGSILAASGMSISNMVPSMNGGCPPMASCSRQQALPPVPPPPLNLPQSNNSNMVSYPIMSHTQLPSSSLG